MQAITDQHEEAVYRQLLVGMTTKADPTLFESEWVRENCWKVVPVEDTAHLALEEIERLIPILRAAGHRELLAIATEPVAPGPDVYRVDLTEDDLKRFNIECGMLTYLLTTTDRSWAVSCGLWFNLFAGPPHLLEEMLGQSIDAARAEFMVYARTLAAEDDWSALIVADRYAFL